MDASMFAKLRVKPGMTARVLHAPEGYPATNELTMAEGAAQTDFTHLFVESREHFAQRIGEALAHRKPGGLLWISYLKGSGKQKPDINRDSLWDLCIPLGIHPVSQVALDSTWSAVRFADNEPGTTYARPNARE